VICLMKPEITIGICVKNCESTIKDAINSVLEQDYPCELIELIIVDGYSTDKTLDIIRSMLEKSRARSKIFREDNGLGYARQIVVDKAEGNYIIWVDGDMMLTKNYVKKLVEFVKKHPEVGVVKGKQSLKGGNLLATLEACSRAVSKMIDYQSEEAHLKALGTSGSIYRVKAVRQVGGFDENLRGYGEDFDIEIRIKAAGWLFRTIDVEYFDYERNKLTWNALWKRYWLRGYYNHYFFHKYSGFIKHYKMFPPAAFLGGILHSHRLFGLTNQRSVFLLPFQYFFKMTGWYFGFIRSHLDCYEPRS
jgi:glycosyltransferase involved in cell wall biosynthesis